MLPFFLPCPHACNSSLQTDNNQYDLSNKTMHFSTMPFFKEHIRNQIEAAGGTVYNHFEDIPKNRHRTTVLLAPFPCLTAAYIQCLASNIPVSVHDNLGLGIMNASPLNSTPHISARSRQCPTNG